jgi:hypothetical protein
MARLTNIIKGIRNWYKGWLRTDEPLYLFIWVMLIVLLWIKLFHTV